MSNDLDRLAQRYWDAHVQAEPLWASFLGDHRYDDALPDISAAGEAAYAATLRDIATAAEAIEATALAPTDRYTRAMLISEAGRTAELLEARTAEFTVTPMFEGPQAQLLHVVPLLTLPGPEHAEALVARYHKVPVFLEQGAERLREGVAAGRTPPRLGVEQTVAQIDRYLSSTPDDDPFLAVQPPSGWSGTQSWSARLNTVVRDVVRPAMGAYRDVLLGEILPVGRPPETSGLCWLPDGEQTYQRCMRYHITLDLKPAAVHQLGHDAIAALDDEYRVIGSRVFGDIDRAGVLSRLVNDEQLRYTTSDEIIADAQEAMARAEAAVGGWFGRLPSTPCVVEPQNPTEAAAGVFAYYMEPATDGSRPGSYKVNTTNPADVTRFDSEATAFHEALPGHHLQIALTQELALPEFRKQSVTTAYAEGWGLYTERLADEMGLYSGDMARLGMLSLDSMRSARLVVDTGIHALRWTRQQAIDYLTEYAPLPPAIAVPEIDRYIAAPAQALAYKVGQSWIRRLRTQAEQRLGARFDIRAFHDAVLGEGALSLDILETAVDQWVASHGD